jgi:hypothetical protein
MMRLAAFSVAGLIGLGLWVSPASAMPLGSQPPALAAPSDEIIQVGGRCGPYAHWVPGHRNRFGRFIPPHCRHFHHHHRHWR